MRFFNIILPVVIGVFTIAAPTAFEKKDVVSRLTSTSSPLDVLSTLTDLQSNLQPQLANVTANPTDTDIVAHALQIVEGLLTTVINLLSGATFDSSITGSVASVVSGTPLDNLTSGSGLGSVLDLTSILSRAEMHSVAKRQTDDQLNTIGQELQVILTGVQAVLAALPTETTTLPLVGQLITALDPLLVGLVSGVNSLVPGIIDLVRTLLQTVGGVLNGL